MRNERVMRWALALGLAAFAGVPSARAEVFETYTSGMPMPSQINMTNDVSKNAWLATNCYVWGNGGIFVSTNKNHFATSDYRLPVASVGMAYGFSPYAYNLGDDLQPPEAVDKIDWQATYDAYLAQLKEDGGNELTGGFVFVLDGDSSRVVAARGSVLTLSWVLTDGTTKEVTYNIAPYGSDRPKRIYWTDYPYNNQKVDLSGKFVKFFGKPSLVTPERITSTNDLGGVQVVENDKIVSGLYLNKDSMTLEARGEVEGQVLMVYYSDGNYKAIQHMQVVEVVRPDTIVIKRSIGRPVAANGRGYKVSGLKPIVQAGIGDVKDGYGDYLYQHQGSHSYSEHNGDVYPIRPTRGEPWKAEVCWMEEDPMKVYWPFEIDQYESDWPVIAATYVRGDLSDAGQGITFPEIYTPTLMTYQEPFGHAKDVDSGNVFTTDLRNTSTNVGYSLVKLIGSDDTIAFLTVKSVLRSNTDYYTLAPQEVVVGQELSVDGIAWSAVSSGHRLGAASDAGPYVYQPGTPALNYDARLYNETNSVSSVYPISAAGTIEVWWKTRVQNDSMSEPVDVPSLPVVYSPRWPETTEAPQIVLASQKGSADETLYGHYGAATFDSSLARLKLPERRYFPNGSGTFAFWTRAAASDDGSGLDNAPSCLVQLGNAAGEAILLRIGEAENLQLLKAGQDAPIADLKLPAVSQTDPWMHIALTIENGQDFTLSVNGTNHQAKVSLPAPATFLGEHLDACGMGCAFGSITNVLQRTIELGAAVGRQVAEVVVYDRVLTADEIAAEKYTVHTGDEEGLTGYWSFRPDEDLVTSVLAGDVDRRAYRDRTAEKKPSLTNAAHNVILSLPGAPLRSTSILIPDDGTEPTIYRQNDSSQPGYNPNEEHAFVESGGDGYIVWALRCDLGKGGERQGVFAEYVKDGRSRLQFYHVLPTNDEHPTFGATCTAGFMLPGPLPLTTMTEDPWLAEDWWWSIKEEGVYRDRKGQLWCRRGNAVFDIFMYYANQETFDWPTLSSPPPSGVSVPWLSVHAGGNALTGRPQAWRWTTKWDENAPEMKIGQTLTTASDGLAEVWNARSVAVVYPAPTEGTGVVMLSDPTVMQKVELSKDIFPGKLGLSAEPNGGLTRRQGKYRFTEASPFISERLYWDESTERLCLIGEREEKNAGATILFPNVLSAAERQQVKALVKDGMKGKEDWDKAVDALATAPVLPNVTQFETTGGKRELKTLYGAVDHYALTALGGYNSENATPLGSTNYVVVIENDATAETMAFKEGSTTERQACSVADGDAISMHVYKIVPKYYVGRAVTREDANNLLSQQLSVLYTECFGGLSDDYCFMWASHGTTSDGTVPEPSDDWKRRDPKTTLGEPLDGGGLTRFVVGQQGDTLADMVNTYWSLTYQAKSNTAAHAVMGDATSGWITPPALAEGWIQRCFNNVTPFTQRMTDLYDNKAETPVTMLQEAGGPYRGDVALNQDNLTSVGLIELYETLLNKAESMSLAITTNECGYDVSEQLLLAAERLGDLYKVLGDEAYSDAKNPTIGFGQTVNGDTKVEFGSEASSLFCFDNQVKTLLDEELCLLRGRSGVSAPTTQLAPYYNRLVWNFTRGITAGEVAYAVNYAVDGVDNDKVRLSEEEAAALYPQGHGDAYGHYLSALKGWYRLLRNPNFAWSRSQGQMNVADAAINVDYYEEAKFATAAADLAKTAADVVDLTARVAWRDNGDGVTSPGYLDSNPTNAFGYGEWASRGGYGALVNWVVASSLLPEDQTLSSSSSGSTRSSETSKYADQGLTRIDRGNTDELAEICESAASIVRAVDRIDCGLNPLGLSDNAIPFDIAPTGVADGSNTHFEQVRDRATTALGNARKVLERAQTQSNRMRMIQTAGENLATAYEVEEEAFDEQLLSYYGSPYSDDIGPGKTYEQGYEGADLYHYKWMDFDAVGLSAAIKDIEWEALSVSPEKIVSKSSFDAIVKYMTIRQKVILSSTADISMTSQASTLGAVCKPASITGYRVRPGKIQEKLMEFLTQYVATQQAEGKLSAAWKEWKQKKKNLEELLDMEDDIFKDTRSVLRKKSRTSADVAEMEMILNDKELMKCLEEMIAEDAIDVCPSVVGAGLTVVTSPRSIAEAVAACADTTSASTKSAESVLQNSIIETNLSLTKREIDLEEQKADYSHETAVWTYYEDLVTASLAVSTAQKDYQSEIAKLNQLIDACRTVIAEAEAILDKREAARKRQVNALSKLRYNEMLFRKIRDKTLSQYSAAFDLAQKYVFMAAQVYDYETGLKREEDGSDDDFKAQIVATRSLGAFDSDGQPMVADDGDLGLAGYLAQMNANWLVLKPRLGINNPQQYTTWFSLRKELFRIYGDATGDKNWKAELKKYWTDDIQKHPIYQRYCQKFQSQFGLKDQEPGFVIPFSTTVDFAKNLFGNDLAGGDHAYDSTWYSTRIASAGVWFDGYNEKTADAVSSAQGQLAANPTVYLIPTGHDCLRAPGQEDGWYWQFSVVDQVIPAPYAIGSYELDSETWYPSMTDADWEGTDPTVKIRKHPMFRAYYGSEGAQPSDDRLDATRLIGRSVWNDQWYLIIPAGSMNADRDKAMEAFLGGYDINRDGKLDIKPVTDIKIGFRTYSQSGN